MRAHGGALGSAARRGIDARSLDDDLASRGAAILPALLSRQDCRRLRAVYDESARFRGTILMARHGFGRGEYRYFAYPLPGVVEELRASLYELLAPIANRWAVELGTPQRYPAELAEFLAACSEAGQRRPTPLLLRYRAGDYNCLHQDRYGALVFPLQVAILLSSPGEEFRGGELVLVEQRPRMQSRAEVVALGQGDAVAFAVHGRPVRGPRGFYRAQMRHGVSRLTWGERTTLGVIFHDAT